MPKRTDYDSSRPVRLRFPVFHDQYYHRLLPAGEYYPHDLPDFAFELNYVTQEEAPAPTVKINSAVKTAKNEEVEDTSTVTKAKNTSTKKEETKD